MFRILMHYVVGNMADKDLAKVLERKEKRKREGAKDRPKKAKFGRKGSYFMASQVAPTAVAAPTTAPAQFSAFPAYPAPGPSGGHRPESRTCLICKQPGHLYRFCPNKASAAAALGAAPK